MNMTATRLVKKLGFKNLEEINDFIPNESQKMSKDNFDYMFENYPLRFNLLIAGAVQIRCMLILGMIEL